MIVTRVWPLVVLLFLLVPGSAAAQTKPGAAAKSVSRASGQATIYFIRPNSLVGAIWGKLSSPDIGVDGHKVGELVAGTYLVINRPAGQHTLEIQ